MPSIYIFGFFFYLLQLNLSLLKFLFSLNFRILHYISFIIELVNYYNWLNS
jgi:hypothetical protein